MRAANHKTYCNDWDANVHATFGTPGQRTACAATQGINLAFFFASFFYELISCPLVLLPCCLVKNLSISTFSSPHWIFPFPISAPVFFVALLLIFYYNTQVIILGSSGMSSTISSSSNLNFSVLTLSMSLEYLDKTSCPSKAQTHAVLHFLEGIVLGFCLGVLYNPLCSMPWVVSGFYFVPCSTWHKIFCHDYYVV